MQGGQFFFVSFKEGPDRHGATPSLLFNGFFGEVKRQQHEGDISI
jgi:hypothetical protein